MVCHVGMFLRVHFNFGAIRSGVGILSLSKGAYGASWVRAARFDELSMLWLPPN